MTNKPWLWVFGITLGFNACGDEGVPPEPPPAHMHQLDLSPGCYVEGPDRSPQEQQQAMNWPAEQTVVQTELSLHLQYLSVLTQVVVANPTDNWWAIPTTAYGVDPSHNQLLLKETDRTETKSTYDLFASCSPCAAADSKLGDAYGNAKISHAALGGGIFTWHDNGYEASMVINSGNTTIVGFVLRGCDPYTQISYDQIVDLPLRCWNQVAQLVSCNNVSF